MSVPPSGGHSTTFRQNAKQYTLLYEGTQAGSAALGTKSPAPKPKGNAFETQGQRRLVVALSSTCASCPVPSVAFRRPDSEIPRSPRALDARQIDKGRASNGSGDARQMGRETRVEQLGRRASNRQGLRVKSTRDARRMPSETRGFGCRHQGIWMLPPDTLVRGTGPADAGRRAFGGLLERKLPFKRVKTAIGSFMSPLDACLTLPSGAFQAWPESLKYLTRSVSSI